MILKYFIASLCLALSSCRLISTEQNSINPNLLNFAEESDSLEPLFIVNPSDEKVFSLIRTTLDKYDVNYESDAGVIFVFYVKISDLLLAQKAILGNKDIYIHRMNSALVASSKLRMEFPLIRSIEAWNRSLPPSGESGSCRE
jgi:hypothetical protein